MSKRPWILSLLAVSLCTVPGVLPSEGRAQAVANTTWGSFKGVCATGSTGALEVRMMWAPATGWLPDGGVNVYRTGAGGALVKVNASPIKDSLTKPAVLSFLRSNPAGATSTTTFSGVTKTRISSQQNFVELKNFANALANAGTPLQRMPAEIAKSPPMLKFYQGLAPTQKASAIKRASQTPSRMRSEMILTALAHPELSGQLGMSLTDPNPGTGSVTYTLKGLDATGKETVLATTTVVVSPTQTQPPAPVGLDAVQTGQDSVALHWEPYSSADERNLGFPTFNVYRSGLTINKPGTTTPNTLGTKVTDLPLSITYLAGKQTGTQIPSLTTYVDETAPNASVTYSVVTTDAFGRQSAPAQVLVRMMDLRLPLPPTQFVAARSENRTHPLTYVSKTPIPPVVSGFMVVPSQDDQAKHLGVAAADVPKVVYKFFRSSAADLSGSKSDPSGQTSTPPAEVSVQAISPTPNQIKVGSLIDLVGLPAVMEVLKNSLILSYDPKNRTYDLGTPSKDLQNVSQLTLQELFDVKVPTINSSSKPKGGGSQSAPLPQTGSQGQTNTTGQNGTSNQVAPNELSSVQVAALTKLLSQVVGFFDATSVPQDCYLKYTAVAKFDTGVNWTAGFSTKWIKSPLLDNPSGAGTVSVTVAPAFTGKIGHFDVTSKKALAKETAVFRPSVDVVTKLSNVSRQAQAKGATKQTKLVDPNKFKGVPSGDIAYDVKLSWAPINQTSHMRYDVYRAPAYGRPRNSGGDYGPFTWDMTDQDLVNQPWKRIAETDQPNFTDPIQRSHPLTFAYYVVPVNRWGVPAVVPSPFVHAHVKASLPPTIPSGVVATPLSNGSIQVNWTADGPDQAVKSYYITRFDASLVGTTASGDPPLDADENLIGQATATTTKSPSVGQTLNKFGVKSKRPSNASGYVQAMTSRKFDPKGGVTTSFAAGFNAKNEFQKVIVNAIADPTKYNTIGTVDSTTVKGSTATFIDPAPSPGVEYVYQVYAVDADGFGSMGSAPFDTKPFRVAANPVTSLAAHWNAAVQGKSAFVHLTWSPPTDDTPASFIVYRAIGNVPLTGTPPALPAGAVSLGTFPALASGKPQNSFDDSFVLSGHAYTYYVVMIDATGLLSPPVALPFAPSP